MTWSAVLGLDAHPLVLPCALVWWFVTLLIWLAVRAKVQAQVRAQVRARDRAQDRAQDWAAPRLPSVWSLLFWCALGLLAAVTLTPSVSGLGLQPDAGRLGCNLTPPRTGFGLWAPNPERRWNVILTVPLGTAALAWLLARRSAAATLAMIVALGSPAGVELVQASVRSLGRVCALVDVADNVSGVLLGFGAAAAGAGVWAAGRAAVHGLARNSPRRA